MPIMSFFPKIDPKLDAESKTYQVNKNTVFPVINLGLVIIEKTIKMSTEKILNIGPIKTSLKKKCLC